MAVTVAMTGFTAALFVSINEIIMCVIGGVFTLVGIGAVRSRCEDFYKLVVRNLLIWEFTWAADGVVEIFASERLFAGEKNQVSISFVKLRDEVFILNRELTRYGAVWLHGDLWRDENFPIQRQVDVLILGRWIPWQLSLETGVFDDLLLLKLSDVRLYLSSRLLEVCNWVAEDFSSEGTNEKGGFSKHLQIIIIKKKFLPLFKAWL